MITIDSRRAKAGRNRYDELAGDRGAWIHSCLSSSLRHQRHEGGGDR